MFPDQFHKYLFVLTASRNIYAMSVTTSVLVAVTDPGVHSAIFQCLQGESDQLHPGSDPSFETDIQPSLPTQR